MQGLVAQCPEQQQRHGDSDNVVVKVPAADLETSCRVESEKKRA
jgi:hypothetical protein